jgi:DNA-binding CsgD family transcriptional regulator
MFLFGTNMPLVIFFIIIVEIAILFNQWFIYLTRPNEKKRLYHLFLLVFLICYNLAEGFFPDKRISFVPPLFQDFLGFGFGYVFASYCPVFFYGAMELPALKFHGRYGWLFILVPVIVFYGVLYPINHDLSFTRKYVYIIPGIYAATIFTTAIRLMLKAYKVDRKSGLLKERFLVFFSVFPISVTPIFGGWMGLDKWIITTTFNVGFLIVDAIYMRQVVWLSLSEQDKLAELTNKLQEIDFDSPPPVKPPDNFLKNCTSFGLTPREIEVSELVAQGIEYKRIAEILFISEKTVAKHVQNAFFKAGVTNKVGLIIALNK